MSAITVHVAHKSGSAASGVRITGAVSMGGMTKPVRTDREGKAVLEWASGSLSDLYVNGKGHRGPFKNGETHTFQL